MKTLQFNYKLPKYVYSKVTGRFFPSVYWNTQLSCLNFYEQPEPELPNEEWVKIKVKYGGICGSDLNLIFLNDSPATSPFVSFPFTIGHEIVGEIAEIGSKVQGINYGDRVVIDPILSCASRGVTAQCPACANGDYSLCIHKTEGRLSPGLLIGTCRDTGGGWSSCVVAHKSQVFQLPDEVDDLNGVMIEPFSCALHSVLRNPPGSNDTVVVIGGGVIGICVIAAIRALQLDCKIVALVKHEFQGKLAIKYGADEVVYLRKSYVYDLTKILNGKVLQPLFGPEVIQGGADLVFECVGKKQSVNDALRFSRSGGKVVLLGLAGIMNGIDWTTIWLNEIDVKGSFAYSTEEYQGKRVRTFDVSIELIRDKKVDLAPLVTHLFPLEKYRHAITTAVNKKNRSAIKVVFEP